MPGVNKEQLQNYEAYVKLTAEEAALREKIRKTGGSNDDASRIKQVKEELVPLVKGLKAVDTTVEKLVKDIANINGKVGGLTGGFKKLSEQKTDKYLDKVHTQSNKAAEAIGTMATKLGNLHKQGKGSGDLARGLSSILAIESDIRNLSTDKAQLAEANLAKLKQEVQATYQLLESTGHLTDEEKARLNIQLQQVTNLEMQKARTEKLTDLQSKGADAQKSIADFMANFSSKSLGALAIWAGLTKLMQFFTKGALQTQGALGTSLEDSYKFEASWQKSLSPLEQASFLLTGVRDDVRSAAHAAALAGDNLDLMNNKAMAVSDAALAMQSGLGATEVAELAQMMSEVTGLSREAASAQLVGTQALATANKVAPAKVLADMAANSNLLAASTDGSADSMARLAIFARKAGIEISGMSSMADSLLDIETSITAEMNASVMLNRQLNLDAARQAASRNDFEGMAREVQQQLAGIDFEELDFFQRKQLAQAVGISDVGQLAKIMARSDTSELTQDIATDAQKQLKSSAQLAKQGATTNDLLGTIKRIIIAIAAMQAVGGIAGLAKMFRGGMPKMGMKNPMGKMYKGGQKMPGGGRAPAGGARGTSMLGAAMKNPMLKTAGKIGGSSLAAVGIGMDAYSNYQQSGDVGQTIADTAMQNKYALLGASIGTGLTAWSGPGALFGAGAGFLGGTVLDMIAPHIGLASGGTVGSSGTYMVGEKGPELVSLGRGSQVVPNHYMGGLASGALGSKISFMSGTEEKLDKVIKALEGIAGHTAGTEGAVKNIQIAGGK